MVGKPARILFLVLGALCVICDIGLVGCSSSQEPVALPMPATSGECTTPFAALVQRRASIISALAQLRQPNSGAIDAEPGCALIRELVTIDGETLHFARTNQKKCAIPQYLVDQIKSSQATDDQMAQRSCNAAGSR